jgi:hypothetical protein
MRQKLEQAINSYNTTRPHRSLMGMSPVDYEVYLKSIPIEKHQKMEIYTINKLEKGNPNQLKLVFILQKRSTYFRHTQEAPACAGVTRRPFSAHVIHAGV